MEFVAKREVFHNGKLKQAGETIVSNDKLDAIYPHLFARKGNKPVVAKVTEPKQPVTEPIREED